MIQKVGDSEYDQDYDDTIHADSNADTDNSDADEDSTWEGDDSLTFSNSHDLAVGISPLSSSTS